MGWICALCEPGRSGSAVALGSFAGPTQGLRPGLTYTAPPELLREWRENFDFRYSVGLPSKSAPTELVHCCSAYVIELSMSS